MKLTMDTDAGELVVDDHGGRQTFPLYSPAAFNILSRHWVTIGWTQKYTYTFTWLGRPVVQLPEDLIRIQEVVYRVRPDVIVETGVAHGGSLIYYASLCKAMDHGRVLGVDIEIRPHNRRAIEAHELSSFITLIEGSSIDPSVLDRVRSSIQPGERVLVLLDSCHTKAHVLAELREYGRLVSVGSYIIAADGVMEDVSATPFAPESWSWDNPKQAALQFAAENEAFEFDEPPLIFNESPLPRRATTYCPSAFLKRVA
jgi:cephalosporin hydroxylase